MPSEHLQLLWGRRGRCADVHQISPCQILTGQSEFSLAKGSQQVSWKRGEEGTTGVYWGREKMGEGGTKPRRGVG